MSGPKSQDEIERLANWYDTNSTAEAEADGWLEGEVADEPMSVRSIRLPVEMSRRIAMIAEARGLPQTELMRDWIDQCLRAEESGSGLDAVRSTIADALQAIADVGRKSGVVVSVDFASTADKPASVAEIRVSEKGSRKRRPQKGVPPKTAAKQVAARQSTAKKPAAKKAAP